MNLIYATRFNRQGHYSASRASHILSILWLLLRLLRYVPYLRLHVVLLRRQILTQLLDFFQLTLKQCLHLRSQGPHQLLRKLSRVHLLLLLVLSSSSLLLSRLLLLRSSRLLLLLSGLQHHLLLLLLRYYLRLSRLHVLLHDRMAGHLQGINARPLLPRVLRRRNQIDFHV